MASKVCFRCNTERPLEDFHAHPNTRDGRLGKCKNCVQDYGRTYRAESPVYKEYDRARRSRPEYAATVRSSIAKWKRNHPEKVAEYSRSAKKRNRAQVNARNSLYRAVRAGRILREACAVCANQRTEAHHADYSQPLKVTWLCKLHHELAHHKEVYFG